MLFAINAAVSPRQPPPPAVPPLQPPPPPLKYQIHSQILLIAIILLSDYESGLVKEIQFILV